MESVNGASFLSPRTGCTENMGGTVNEAALMPISHLFSTKTYPKVTPKKGFNIKDGIVGKETKVYEIN